MAGDSNLRRTPHLVVALVLVVLASACGSTSESTAPPGSAGTIAGSPPSFETLPGHGSLPAETLPSAQPLVTAAPDPTAFDAADAAMRDRAMRGGNGGVLLVVREGTVLFDRSYGSVDHDTVLAVASTSKWFTAATLMTLVDEGLLTLDDPISTWLPAFDGKWADVTLRMLLSHRSGVRDQDCIWNTGAVLADCVDQLAAGPTEFAPGTAFSYGNAPFHVAARLGEVVTGLDFQTLFAERIGGPLGMTSTSWSGGGTTRNPSPAASARTTVADTERFLQMMLADGAYDGRQILAPESVAEIEKNQVAGYDTSRDFAVNITRIPTYGLGTWRDVPDADDNTVVVSGNGANGYYPWIDHANHAYGIVGVQDTRGAEVAVPASKVVVDLAITATAAGVAG
jgi:CubicO group peptidase (beta-lactamase class C family)